MMQLSIADAPFPDAPVVVLIAGLGGAGHGDDLGCFRQTDASGARTGADAGKEVDAGRGGRQREAQDDNSPACDQSTVKPWRFLCDNTS